MEAINDDFMVLDRRDKRDLRKMLFKLPEHEFQHEVSERLGEHELLKPGYYVKK